MWSTLLVSVRTLAAAFWISYRWETCKDPITIVRDTLFLILLRHKSFNSWCILHKFNQACCESDLLDCESHKSNEWFPCLIWVRTGVHNHILNVTCETEIKLEWACQKRYLNWTFSKSAFFMYHFAHWLIPIIQDWKKFFVWVHRLAYIVDTNFLIRYYCKRYVTTVTACVQVTTGMILSPPLCWKHIHRVFHHADTGKETSVPHGRKQTYHCSARRIHWVRKCFSCKNCNLLNGVNTT